MQVLELIKETAQGKKESQDLLFEHVYEDLRKLARKIRFDWRNKDTLNTTALVHEAYLKVTSSTELSQLSKLHFYRICGRAMKFILNDYLKYKSAAKRGGSSEKLSFDDNYHLELSDSTTKLVEDLLDKIDELKSHDPVINDVIECRFFSNLTVDETSQILAISPATVKRKWAFARSFISSDLSKTA